MLKNIWIAVNLIACKLYANYSLPRSCVHSIVNDVTDMFNGPLELLEKNLLDHSKTQDDIAQELVTCISNLKRRFMTEKLNINEWIFSESTAPTFLTQKLQLAKKTKQHKALGIVPCVAYYVSTAETLLEISNVFDVIYSNMVKLYNTTACSNIIQSVLWTKVIAIDRNKIVLPIFLYYDEFEVANPLGSHAGVYKMRATYFSIGYLPLIYSSQLENIFLAQLNFFKNFACDIMHDLYEGICQYEWGYILYNFIYVEKHFDLDMLNQRLQYFNFTAAQIAPPPVNKIKVNETLYYCEMKWKIL